MNSPPGLKDTGISPCRQTQGLRPGNTDRRAQGPGQCDHTPLVPTSQRLIDLTSTTLAGLRTVCPWSSWTQHLLCMWAQGPGLVTRALPDCPNLGLTDLHSLSQTDMTCLTLPSNSGCFNMPVSRLPPVPALAAICYSLTQSSQAQLLTIMWTGWHCSLTR